MPAGTPAPAASELRVELEFDAVLGLPVVVGGLAPRRLQAEVEVEALAGRRSQAPAEPELARGPADREARVRGPGEETAERRQPVAELRIETAPGLVGVVVVGREVRERVAPEEALGGRGALRRAPSAVRRPAGKRARAKAAVDAGDESGWTPVSDGPVFRYFRALREDGAERTIPPDVPLVLAPVVSGTVEDAERIFDKMNRRLGLTRDQWTALAARPMRAGGTGTRRPHGALSPGPAQDTAT